MEGLDEAARFAAAAGCNRMTFVMPAGSETPKNELWKTLKARFTAVGAVLARHNVRLGLEFRASLQLRSASPYEFIWRMNEMLQFASECGPNLGLLLDSWHWYHSGASLDDILKAGKSRIVTVHVSDSAKTAPQGRARQLTRSIACYLRGRDRSDWVPQSLKGDRVRRRHKPRALRPHSPADAPRGGCQAGAREHAGGDEEGRRQLDLESSARPRQSSPCAANSLVAKHFACHAYSSSVF